MFVFILMRALSQEDAQHGGLVLDGSGELFYKCFIKCFINILKNKILDVSSLTIKVRKILRFYI